MIQRLRVICGDSPLNYNLLRGKVTGQSKAPTITQKPGAYCLFALRTERVREVKNQDCPVTHCLKALPGGHKKYPHCFHSADIIHSDLTSGQNAC